MTINKADYLEEVLDSHKMKHINDLVETYKNRRNEIKSFLKSEFSGKIYEPFDSGSYKKHTAMNAKFDLDLSDAARMAVSTLSKLDGITISPLALPPLEWIIT